MATAGCLLSEETIQCSICLEVLTRPVSTSCGHNFCTECIEKYWNLSNSCQCPYCKTAFSQRPNLQVNTVLNELVEKMKALVQPRASDSDAPEKGAILCNICSKGKAVKSCLMCLASFCHVHLEPHQRVAGYKGHTLLDPVENLEERLCKTHNILRELYCRTDQVEVCISCFLTDHKDHDMVSLKEECESVIGKVDAGAADIQRMKEEHSKKIDELKELVKKAKMQKESSVQDLRNLVNLITEKLSELVAVIEKRFQTASLKCEGLIIGLRRDIDELDDRKLQLERLSKSDDHHDVIQKFPALSARLHVDRTNASVPINLSFEAERRALAQLKNSFCQLMEHLPEFEEEKSATTSSSRFVLCGIKNPARFRGRKYLTPEFGS